MREPTEEEDWIIRFLLKKARHEYSLSIQLESYLVQEMQDGKMGSLYIIPVGSPPMNERETGPMVAEIHPADVDGVELFINLFIDTNQVPFELDIWKVDFSPLRSLSNAVSFLRKKTEGIG